MDRRIMKRLVENRKHLQTTIQWSTNHLQLILLPSKRRLRAMRHRGGNHELAMWRPNGFSLL